MGYVALSTCPNALGLNSHLAYYTEEIFQSTRKTMRILLKYDKILRQSSSIDGIKNLPIKFDTVEDMVCINYSFSVNPDLSSQQRIILMFRDAENGTVNILHYSSTKSKRVCNSVFAAERFAMVDRFDSNMAVKEVLVDSTSCKNIPLVLCTASHTLYGLCISLNSQRKRPYNLTWRCFDKPTKT